MDLDRLAELKVLDLDSREVRFGDLWKDGTAVIVFVRHFG